MPGVSPGRRSAPRGPARTATASPFDLAEPPSGSVWPNVPSAGRLPARHRDDRDTALDCALRRPRRRQPTTLPLAALWMAAPYHAVTKAARGKLLANPLPPLARRPLLPPVTTPFATSAPTADRVVTGGIRAESPPSPRRPNDARGASRRPRPERHAQGFGPDFAQPTAWAAPGIVALATLVRAAGVDRAGRLRAARRRADVRRSPARRAERFEPYRVRAAPRDPNRTHWRHPQARDTGVTDTGDAETAHRAGAASPARHDRRQGVRRYGARLSTG